MRGKEEASMKRGEGIGEKRKREEDGRGKKREVGKGERIREWTERKKGENR